MDKTVINRIIEKLQTIHTNLSVGTEFSIKIAMMQIDDAIQMLREAEDDSNSSDRI